jgi:oxygen-independent coproporphyrinogen III oxidase
VDQNLLPFALQDMPRYTSYPTAVQFDNAFPRQKADQWLAELAPDATLSLYVHIPFCQQLCYYCGCHTSVPNTYARATRYVDTLVCDIARTSRVVGGARGRVKHLHFGGGTPTYLNERDIARILDAMDKGFGITSATEIALESDPRTLTAARAIALAALGFNRISFGVQDFDGEVQSRINRVQPFAQVAEATRFLRHAGFTAINFDLMYGLPGQTRHSVRRTAEQAASLAPDRLAVFGYAHVPWFKRHQRLIKDEDLPGVTERYAQATVVGEELCKHGYQAIGLDHYARAQDPLATAAMSGTLRRNFQGYTTDAADALLAFGASAISELPQGFCQAARDTLQWSTAIKAQHNPANRGLARTAADRCRAEIIERLMCDLTVDYLAIADRHGRLASEFRDIAERLAPLVAAGIATCHGSRITVAAEHRLFLRNVAAVFDAYFTPSENRHAKAV